MSASGIDELFSKLTMAANSNGSGNELDVVRDNRTFQQLRQLYLQDPGLLETTLHFMIQQHPQFGQFLSAHYQDFMSLMKEDTEGRLKIYGERIDIFWPEGINYGEAITVSVYNILGDFKTWDEFEEEVYQALNLRKHRLEITDWLAIEKINDGRFEAEMQNLAKQPSAPKPKIATKRGVDNLMHNDSDEEDEDTDEEDHNASDAATMMDVDDDDQSHLPFLNWEDVQDSLAEQCPIRWRIKTVSVSVANQIDRVDETMKNADLGQEQFVIPNRNDGAYVLAMTGTTSHLTQSSW